MNTSRLFVASGISLVTTSMVFAIRVDIEPAMSAAFQLTAQQMGGLVEGVINPLVATLLRR